MYTCALKLLFKPFSGLFGCLRLPHFRLSRQSQIAERPALLHPALQNLLQICAFEGLGQVIVHSRR